MVWFDVSVVYIGRLSMYIYVVVKVIELKVNE